MPAVQVESELEARLDSGRCGTLLAPGQEALDRHLGLDPLHRREPAGVEPQVTPGGVELVADSGVVQTAGARVLHQQVDDRPERGAHRRRAVGVGRTAEEVVAGAGQQRADLAGAEPDRAVHGLRAAGEFPHPPPGAGVGDRHQRGAVRQPLGGQRGQVGRRGQPTRLGGIGGQQHAAEPAHQGGQGDRRPVGRRFGRDTQFGEEPGRLVGLALGAGGGGDHELVAGAAARQVEQPPLLGDALARIRPGADSLAQQSLRFQQRAGLAPGGPVALLHPGDHDQGPLPPARPVRGEQLHSPATGPRFPLPVGRDLLGRHLVQQEPDPARTGAGGLGGEVEEGGDRVEIAVGLAAGRATGQRLRAQPGRPAGRVPGRPGDLVGTPAGLAPLSGGGQDGHQLRQPGATRIRRAVGEPARLVHRPGEHVVGGGGLAGGVEHPRMGRPPLPHQPAQPDRVEAGQRRGEQLHGLLGGDCTAGRDAEHEQQRTDGVRLGQHDLVTGDLDRDACGGAGPRDHRQASAGSGQHGHLAVSDPPLDPGAAQFGGDRPGLVSLAPAGQDSQGPRPGGRHRVGGGAGHGDRQPGGQALQAGGQLAAGAEPLPQHHHVAGAAVGTGEDRGELGRDPGVGAAEGVHGGLRVGGCQDGAAVGHQGADQTDLGRVEVGDVVNQDGVVAPANRRQHVGLGEQDARAVDQFGVVEGTLGVQHVEVLGEEPADRLPFRQARLPAVGDHVLRVEAELPGPGEHGADLAGEAAGADRVHQGFGPAGAARSEEFPHPELLLRRGQQPPVRRVGVLVDQGAGQGMDRGDRQLGGAADRPRDPVAQRAGRLPPRCQHQRTEALREPPGGRPGHQRGLPGARPAQHQQRALPALQRDGLLFGQAAGVGGHVLGGHTTMQSPGTDTFPHPTRTMPQHS